ncbi:hypothetical protein JCM19379_21010 [Methyloparacoccus murrellii]
MKKPNPLSMADLNRLPLLLGLGLVLAGSAWMIGNAWKAQHPSARHELLDIRPGSDLRDSGISPRFPVERLSNYRIETGRGVDIRLGIVDYRDDAGQARSVIVYPANPGTGLAAEPGTRMSLWGSTAQAIREHTQEDALFLSWWDNAQRIHFLTGRETWPRQAARSGFADSPLRDFWIKAAGGAARDEQPAIQLAKWLTMDAEQALADIRRALPSNRPLYWLVCVDDLARLGEIEALSGVKIPLEMRYFPPAPNIHAQIAAVRRWASEAGDLGNYLVQQIPGGGVKAWRITTEAGSRTLLARLLPFTQALENPLPDTHLVHQSTWGAYLVIHEILPART